MRSACPQGRSSLRNRRPASTAPTPLPELQFVVESSTSDIILSGTDAEGQWIDTVITSLPSHGTLEVVPTAVGPSWAVNLSTTVTAADLPLAAASVYPAYGFKYTPATNDILDVIVGSVAPTGTWSVPGWTFSFVTNTVRLTAN